MFVVKRNGEKVSLKLDKVQKRLKDLAKNLNVDTDQIAVKAIERMYDGIESREIDKHLALITVNNNIHYHYNILAGKISVSALHKETAIDQLLEGEKEKLSELMKSKLLTENNKLIQKLKKSIYKDDEREKILSDYLEGKKVGIKKIDYLVKAPRFFRVTEKLFEESLINERVYNLVKKHRKEIEEKIDYSRDFMFDFFGFETLKAKYLMQVKESYFEKINDDNIVSKQRRVIIERPQDLFMRVSLAVRSDNLEKAFELYDLMSNGYYTHATPTLFNAGTNKEQMSSCFLLSTKEDSINGIYDTLKECALISQSAGGIGLSIHNVRAKGSYIKGTGGVSNGIVPMLKVFNETARYVDQCFVPETKIYTKDGIKKIKEVQIGDYVFNQKGSLTEVEKVFRTDIRQLINVLTLNDKVKVTDAHPIFSIKSKNLEDSKNKISEAKYLSVSELTLGDTIGFKIPTHEKDLDLSKDDCIFYAKILKNGFINRDSDKVIMVNPDSFVKSYLNERQIKYIEIEDNIEFSPSQKMFKFNRESLFNGSDKRIHKSLLHLPVEKTKLILDELFSESNYLEVSEGLRSDINYLGLKNKILLKIENNKIYKPHFNIDFYEYEGFLFTSLLNKEKEFYSGVVYDLKVKEEASYMTSTGLCHNGGGKRKGSFAIYLEPWHSDVKDFLHLKKNTGADEKRTRDLFPALWVPNLLGKRVKEGGKWSLFDPKDVPLLYDTYGDEFEKLYEQYEKEGKALEILDAREFMLDIFETQIETGGPYMVNKDESNKKSNQKNLGTIRSSNLCCVSESQRVPTNKGIKTVKELYDDATANIVVGREKLEEATQMFLPRPQAEIYIINTSDGYTHEVTKDHKVWVQDLGWKEAQDLVEGDKISIQQFKGLFGNLNLSEEDLENELAQALETRKIGDKIWISNEKTMSLFYQKIKNENLSLSLMRDLQILALNLGIKLSITKDNLEPMENNYTKFKSLDFKGIEDAYCLSVHSEEHSWVCNGIVTKNTEIIEYTSEEENAVCNLASVCLPKFVENGKFNHKKFHKIVQVIIENLDMVIDRNYYVDEKTKRSNMRHRPVGLGVQGLADVFFKLKLPYGSPEAKKLNKDIFETMYHAAVTKSLELAKEKGHYPSMKENGGAPISKGILQFDMWNVEPSSNWKWDELKEEIKKYGLRNSLLVAPMPTASTSQIFYNTESFEPLTAMLYKRKVDGKEYVVVNKYMIDHFEELGIWNEKLVNDLILNDGSVASLDYIDQEVKKIYKTVWELSLKAQIDMAADRGAYICQSQSFNIHMKDPTMKKMADFFMYAFEKGLKTMSYYFRTNAATQNAKATVSSNSLISSETEEDDDCLVCGS